MGISYGERDGFGRNNEKYLSVISLVVIKIKLTVKAFQIRINYFKLYRQQRCLPNIPTNTHTKLSSFHRLYGRSDEISIASFLSEIAD